MPLDFPKVVAGTLRRQVADRVRESILSGALRPGEKLVERKIAIELGTSLTAVREAIIQLESEGFIRKKANTNTCVSDFGLADIEAIIPVRQLLEGYAFEEAARNATDEDKEKLEELLAQSAKTARKKDRLGYIRRDLLWHDSVWQVARNECLLESLRRIIYPLFAFSTMQVAAQPGFDLIADSRTHDPLLKAILENDPKAVRRAFDNVSKVWAAEARNYFSAA